MRTKRVSGDAPNSERNILKVYFPKPDNNFEDMDVYQEMKFKNGKFKSTFNPSFLKKCTSLLSVLLLPFLFMACVAATDSGTNTTDTELGDGSSGSSTGGGSGNSSLSDPTFTQANSFFQDGFVNYSGVFLLSSNFNDSVNLKGREIHNFLKDEPNRNITMCLVARFPSSTNNKLLILELNDRFETQSGSNTQERFYRFQSSDESRNSGSCGTPGLTTQLNNLYPGETKAFIFDDVCPGCNFQINSQPIQIFDSAGNEYTSLATNLLSFQFLNVPVGSTSPGCTDDLQCQSLGNNFDCCLAGQCVADQAVRPEVDQTTTAFQSIELLVKQQPSRIFDYPDIYFICPSGAPPNQDPQPSDPDVERFTKLQRLHNCVSPEDNEEGLCTITFENAGDDISAGNTFSVLTDDTDFVDIWSGPTIELADFESRGSIQKVEYAGSVLYDSNHYDCMRAGFECYNGNSCTTDANLCAIEKLPGTTPACNFDVNNNNVSSNSNIFADAQCLKIKTSFASPADAPHDRLEITYRVDGSCEKLNSLTAKCEKSYVQGQKNFAVDDKSPGSQTFDIPSYADTSKQITVFVDGLQAFENSDWNLTSNDIVFDSSSMTVFDGQKVRIQFFVDISGGKDTIFQSQDVAQTEINNFCQCTGDTNCGLTPVKQTIAGVETTIDYVCDYPELPNPDPPLEQQLFLSSKSVPHRFYDTGGKLVDEFDITTGTQEGNAFEYTSNNKLIPNNVGTYIGFNEIYGTISPGSTDAKPPLQVDVKKGRFYNIFVNNGSLQSCNGCGSDYYSSLNRVFPDVFIDAAAGFDPDPFRTSRDENLGWPQSYRSDELHFGRSCFVPATMIPWTHESNADLFTQRTNRLKAQHFLFSNGYQRDWYGFDYGAIIGSFDGVKWFAVGSARQIKAETNKMYLAVNALFGDIRPSSGFNVRVNEVVANDPNFTIPTTDFDTDAAQCQSYHVCDTDQDCATQLGWDYVCENISGARTTWPLFNANGDEIADSETTQTLRSMFGSSSGPAKRCVYRGRGSLCHGNYGSMTASNSYTQTNLNRLHGCSANNYCESITETKFNIRIARYEATPAQQNNSSSVPSTEEDHTFGLGARLIGRPYKFNGDEDTPSQVSTNLANNNASEICIPGRNASAGSGTTFNTLNAALPDSTDNLETGDIVGNIGVTNISNATTDGVSRTMVAACPTFDESGNLHMFEDPTLAFDDTTIAPSAFSQNLTTSVFSTFVNPQDSIEERLISKFTSIVDNDILQENRCMRAPGSACHTDLDCSPPTQVANVFKSIDPLDASSYGTNGYEIEFWREELVCGQKSEKFSLNYDLKNNVCCRETGKKITVGTADVNSKYGSATDASFNDISAAQPPGYAGNGTDDVTIGSPNKYSRVTTAFYQMDDNPDDFPPLAVSANDSCTAGGVCDPTSDFEKQYNTLNETVGATCCTGHWIREFDQSNGGGHKWSKGKFQSIDKRNFECLNYIMTNAADDLDDCLNTDSTDSCDCATDPTDPTNCRIRSIPLNEADRYNEFFSSLELTGIPNILIQSADSDFETNGDPVTCRAVHGSRDITTVGQAIDGTIDSTITTTDAEANENVAGLDLEYLKASDENNFDDTIKKVFSEDEFTCCLPGGTTVTSTVNEDSCCTGNIANVNGNLRCCLPDYTNVTVYLNRYVSSEMKDFPDSDFDPKTGRPLSFQKVAAFARNICCSGSFASGEAFGEMGIPTASGFTNTVNRFVSGNRTEDNINNNATNYDRGLRWNTDVYCVPSN